ncbi:uncharacterized protein LOC119082071 [Bradysia coprophila]|uniref:uncharacterized protein LOC119082071 n=1 Tax=Bradysia coprophila TaxID=38358 RepID=UPI00187D8CEE|nr:uncharacterized protein LOC119082071 [Bradysia coprophila]
MWQRCNRCKRQRICRSNLLKLLGGSVIAGALGVFAVIGFGILQAHTTFAFLQVLGSFCVCLHIFDDGTVTAIGRLGMCALKLDWCNYMLVSMKIRKVKDICGCTKTYVLTVRHVENLRPLQTLQFQVGANSWTLSLRRTEFLSFGMISEKLSRVKVAINISSDNLEVSPIRREIIRDIAAGGGFYMHDIISWKELLRAENRYVKNACLAMEIEITDGKFFVDLREKDELRPRLESLFRTTGMKPVSSPWASLWKSRDSGVIPKMKITKTEKSCDLGCLTTLELTVDNIENIRTLGSTPRTPSATIKIGKSTWTLEVTNYDADYVGLKLRADKEFDVRVVIQVRSDKTSVLCIRKVIMRHIEPDSDLCVDQLLLWSELIDPYNGFIMDAALKIEVELTNGLYILDHVSP